MTSHGDFVDFGKMTPEDIKRVTSEVEARGSGKFEIDPEWMKGASEVGKEFVLFVQKVLTEMGLLDSAGIANVSLAVAKEFDEHVSDEVILREMWSERAKDWAVIESALNYAITMQTLMEFFQVDSRRRYQTILSLASGPGLYETFLGALLQRFPNSSGVSIICVDYALEMTRRHKEILRQLRTPAGDMIRAVCPVTGDMMNLEFPSGAVDQIICNNSLQWCMDWKKAIAEMGRVMRPEGLGWVYLFVHSHPMAILALSEKREIALRLGEFQLPELLDELEANQFVIHHIRHIGGTSGTGQAGGATRRVFVLARYQATGKRRQWRESSVTTATSLVAAP